MKKVSEATIQAIAKLIEGDLGHAFLGTLHVFSKDTALQVAKALADPENAPDAAVESQCIVFGTPTILIKVISAHVMMPDDDQTVVSSHIGTLGRGH